MQGSGVCDVDRRLRRIEVKSFRLILSALLCAVLSVAAGSAQAQQAQQASAAQPRAQRNLLVGVVDLRAVLANHPVVTDEIPALTQKLRLEQVEFGKAQQEAQANLEKLQQTYKVGTPEYEDQMGAVRKSLSDAQFKAEEARQKIVMQRTQLLFRAYKDLQAAMQEVAKLNGILIVHSKVKLNADSEANVSEEFLTLQEADQNTIVWNRPECDITEQVKAQLAKAVGVSSPKKADDAESPLANLGSQAINASQVAPTAPNAQAAPAVNRTASAPNVGVRR